jgi:hypothetical protein
MAQGEDLAAFYRHCAAARQRLQAQAVQALPREQVLKAARSLNLPLDADMAQIGEADLAFAFDLALHTASPGRPSVMTRFAASLLHRQRDRASSLVLMGLAHAWLSVFRVLGPHPEAGLLLEDALLGGEVWLLEEELGEIGEPGRVLASRVARVEGFAITCGVVAPLDEAMLDQLRRLIGPDPAMAAEMLADARLARSLWQQAVGLSVGGASQGD